MPSEVERVVIISDIHMGADNGREIFTAQKELAQFIDHLTSLQERMDLVILGDALDYLQIKPYLDFTNTAAVTKTDAIVKNNKHVFAALREFVGSGKRIRWCIGNHDIELLFSDVRQIIEAELLPDGDNDARLLWEIDDERINYSLSDGRRVRLVHGNKYDPWNGIDYKKAKNIANTSGSQHFEYPPGSKLVANVMNLLKDSGFRHIDLLKPEVKVALLLALALWPEDTCTHLRKAIPNLFDAGVRGGWQLMRNLVDAQTFGSDTDSSTLEAYEDELFVKSLHAALTEDAAEGSDQSEKNRIDKKNRDIERDLKSLLTDPATAANAFEPSSEDTFGSSEWPFRCASHLLRRAAHWANRELNPWSTEKPDELDSYVRDTFIKDKDVAVVIAGHTHLARAVSYKKGYYINTGTWANLMHIPTYFNGAEFVKHAKELRGYFSNPETAPAELRPFQRFTYADVDLRPKDGKPFRAELREWIDEPSRKITRFP